MYYKTGTWVFKPTGTVKKLKFAEKGDFGKPVFRDEAPDTLSRQVIKGKLKGTWHDCIELN